MGLSHACDTHTHDGKDTHTYKNIELTFIYWERETVWHAFAVWTMEDDLKGNQFLPSTSWVPELELRWSGSAAVPLSHLSSPQHSIHEGRSRRSLGTVGAWTRLIFLSLCVLYCEPELWLHPCWTQCRVSPSAGPSQTIWMRRQCKAWSRSTSRFVWSVWTPSTWTGPACLVDQDMISSLH